MDPATATLIASGVQSLGAGLMGGSKEPQAGNLHLVNPQQQLLYNKMLQGLLGGGGDFGYGSNVKAGTSQLQNMMASRGIKVGTGGAYSGAYGNMVGNALGQDAQARRQYAMGLLQSPLQTATVTGANLIPGSTSAGYSGGAQEGSWNLYRSTGYVQPGVGMSGGTGPGGRPMAYPTQAANAMEYERTSGEGSLQDRVRRSLQYNGKI